MWDEQVGADAGGDVGDGSDDDDGDGDGGMEDDDGGT